MAVTERLALLITANPQQAISGLQSLERNADKTLRTTEQKIDRMGQRFTKVGAVMLTAGGLAAAGLFKAGLAASDLQQQVGGTEAVFGKAADVVGDFAKSAATSVGLSEREFRSLANVAGGMLKNLGASEQEASEQGIQLVQIGADLAATYGGTTREAVEALTAALRGEADPAERFALDLKVGSINAEAMALGLAKSEKQIDANAKRQAFFSLVTKQAAGALGQFNREQDTAAGQAQIARAELDNMVTSLGAGVLPLFSKGAGFVAGLARKFNELDEATKGTASQLAIAGTAVLLVGGALSTAVGKAIQMRENLKVLTTALGSAGKAATALRLGLAGLGAAVAVVGIVELADALDGADAKMSDLSELADKELVKAFDNWGSSLFESNFQLQAFRELTEENIATAERMRDALAAQGEDVSALDDILRGAAEGAKQLGDDQERASDIADGATGAFERQGAAAGLTAEQIDDLRKALKDYFDEASSVLDADINLEAAFDDLRESIKDNGVTLDITTEKGRANAEQAIKTRDSILGAADAYLRNGGTAEGARRKVETLTRRFFDQMRQAGFTKDQVFELGRQLGLLPHQVTTFIEANTNPAQQSINRFIRDNDGRVIRVVTQNEVVFVGGGLRARAHGGPVEAGHPFLVGERGAELFVPSTNGRIVPNQALRAGGAGGGLVVNVTVQGNVVGSGGMRQFAQEIRRELLNIDRHNRGVGFT